MNYTLYDKIWNEHSILVNDDDSELLYIDRHLVHEVTSPQAFDGLAINNRKVWSKKSICAVSDHNVPTRNRVNGIKDSISKLQVDTLIDNCKKHKINYFDLNDINQGIVHVIGPELGFTQPGMTLVCGDSHTSTHGAFGCLAMGIGTSEVEHVLATQSLKVRKLKNMRINFEGSIQEGVSSKDIILYLIRTIGTAGGTGYAVEFAGSYIRNISMEARMTICNMSIEAGAKVGLVSVDDKTIKYVKKHSNLEANLINDAIKKWKNLTTDKDAMFDKEIDIDVSKINPQVSWGTSPEMVIDFNEKIPSSSIFSAEKRKSLDLAKNYMGLSDNQELSDLDFDKVFIGSCTNSRIEDLREAAEVLKGQKVSENIQEAIVVPGSGMVKEQAEKEGIHKIFIDAGFQWRAPGCSMCLGMNPDQLSPYERCASTSNRNFEGRQGNLGRTHLMSPKMAALTAINGRIVKEI